jgi:hypothetical protein
VGSGGVAGAEKGYTGHGAAAVSMTDHGNAGDEAEAVKERTVVKRKSAAVEEGTATVAAVTSKV